MMSTDIAQTPLFPSCSQPIAMSASLRSQRPCMLERTRMTTRSEIQDTLAAAQEKVMAYFEGLSPEALESPCTASGVSGEVPWRAKDHFAHLTANEQGIQTLLRLTLTGASLPTNLTTMSAEERLAWSNQRNQTYVNAHYNDRME